jgi:hypothetical protein
MKICAIRVLQLTEYGFTLEIERHEGEGCLDVMKMFINNPEFQIQILDSETYAKGKMNSDPCRNDLWIVVPNSGLGV